MILLDTDVLIDIALDRSPYSESAADILERLENGERSAFIAWHTISNFYYLVAPKRGGADARDFIVELTRFVAVAECGADAIWYAASLPMNDFEDAMQVAAARACGAQYIVTRNTKDFSRSPIPAISPVEALGRLFRLACQGTNS
ncbi:MAG: PIN domain-containing protein [Gammaproteobacteria bacterium]|nr:PIN domain-containing protein [Gammaproteobacteria bacterium]